MQNIDAVIKFLSNLGLDFEESKIFLAVMQRGGMTILEISRVTQISRTNVYRLVDKMLSEGLLEQSLKGEKKLIFSAGSHKLELLVKEQEEKSRVLKEIFPEVSTLITTNASASQPGTRVLFYKGVEGIKQMVWNTLKAKREVVGYSYRELREVVGKEFAAKWKEEFMLRRLRFRDLVSDSYIESSEEKRSFIISTTQNFETRYIPSTKLDINHQVDIYEDVVAYYNWYEGDVFGVEIYNEKIARMQKQLFEIVWSTGKVI